jgi:hypothetical protein
MALCLDEDSPVGFEATQGVVQTTGKGDEFGGHGAIEIRPPRKLADR